MAHGHPELRAVCQACDKHVCLLWGQMSLCQSVRGPQTCWVTSAGSWLQVPNPHHLQPTSHRAGTGGLCLSTPLWHGQLHDEG